MYPALEGAEEAARGAAAIIMRGAAAARAAVEGGVSPSI